MCLLEFSDFIKQAIYFVFLESLFDESLHTLPWFKKKWQHFILGWPAPYYSTLCDLWTQKFLKFKSNYMILNWAWELNLSKFEKKRFQIY